MRIDPSNQKQVLVADDEEAIRRLLDYNLRKSGYEPILTNHGKEAIARASDDFACALIDLKMPEADGLAVLQHLRLHHPDLPVIIMSAVGQVRDAVAAMKQGAFEYITKPFDFDQLLVLMKSATQLGNALRENRELRESVLSPSRDQEFVGVSPAMQSLRETVKTIAPLDSTVLISGESGVGKGLLARLIHRASKRASHPFVTTSCPAMPGELLESEMFGHERGAFTGAVRRRLGRVEMASGGTLFLDEIGELPLSLQPKLLNVLQDRQFQRVGSSETIAANIRLIAATNANLLDMVAARTFREDLYYRLNVIQITVPPLRDRPEDIPLLAKQILFRIAAAQKREPLEIADDALRLFCGYYWPGNVRELENALERASAFCPGKVIQPGDLPPDILRPAKATTGTAPPADNTPQIGGMTLDDIEKLALRQTLVVCHGNKAAAARSLGVTEKTIYNKLARFGLR